MYQAENKVAFMAHTNERPKIFKPKLCHDCHDDKPTKSDIVSEPSVISLDKGRINNVTEKGNLKERQSMKNQFVPSQIPAPTQSQDEVTIVPSSDEDQDDKRMKIWPSWSSRPPETLGDFVRSVFLDLCDKRSVSELQVNKF